MRFLCADGAPYGQAGSPCMPQLFADVFSALKNMGCQEGIARRAIDLVRPHVGHEERVEEVLRRCLSALRAV